MSDTALRAERRPNRLLKEKSPYLLQHAFNPVDWYPWGEEAFARARAENKPIFLSIGYSTCHWCHVMERESFENPEVAALLNDGFVPVKLDREERPDIDRIYMIAMQAMGAGGGWPLNVFLTPSLEPFFGGTYFPPDASHGRPGMKQLLPRVREAWRDRQGDLEDTGRRVLDALGALDKGEDETAGVDSLLARAADGLLSAEDRVLGGFGRAPKFPSPCNLAFLLRWWHGDPATRGDALDAVTRQLEAMRAGGIHDALGGGFHRYSTDADWLVPHFEKMLYDQAQLAWSYVEAFQVTREARFAETARGIFEYVFRDLSDAEGGFLSAEDADSEGEEGRFYVWTAAQLAQVLGPDEAPLAARHWGVDAHGNFEHGTTILTEAVPAADLAREMELEEGEVRARLARARAALFAARAKRVRPHLDDKVLAAWNGLMISACARGARALGDPALAERAVSAAEFVWRRLWDGTTRTLRRRWRAGEAAIPGQLDDYSHTALGFLDLHQATHDPRWLERAALLVEVMIDRFLDREAGAFFESPAGDDSVRLRLKDGYDGAELAGNSTAVFVTQALATLLDRAEWRAAAAGAIRYYAGRLAAVPAAMPQMLVAMDLARVAPRHAVVIGEARAADTRALVAAFDRGFHPHDILLVTDSGEGRRRLAPLVPFVAPLVPQAGRATAFVCVNHSCRLPTSEPEAFAAQLDAPEAGAIPPEEKPNT
jgi:uncharacterized protein YyaL (SSP411 family)